MKSASAFFKSLVLGPWSLVLLLFLLPACAFQRGTTTIQTPAVYNVSPDAAGHLQTNLVSAASITTRVEKERLWLPPGYAVLHNTVMYGIDVAATDATTQTPKIKLGFADDSWRWIPTASNALYAAPITSSGTIHQSGIPFAVSGTAAFTAGSVSVMQGTNSTATAIVPGTPADQH
jgi:hypothetical protein